jgi:hypothetical protein
MNQSLLPMTGLSRAALWAAAVICAAGGFVKAACADEAAPAAAAEEAAERPVTDVIADDEAGVVRIMVRGKEVARFTAEGLRVEGAVESARGMAGNRTTSSFGEPVDRAEGESP